MSKKNYNKIILLIIVFILLISISACTSAEYAGNVEYGKEYPVSLFPIIEDANIYEYNYSHGTIDIKFGSGKSMDNVKQYYDMTFGHSDYHNTIDKLTNKRYLKAGTIQKYSYLLEISEASSSDEKKLYKTIISLRIVLNDVVDLSIDVTPTPQIIVTNEPTPKVTPEPTSTPEVLATPEPSAMYPLDESDYRNSIDLKDNMVYIQCTKAEKDMVDANKEVTIQLEILNYGDKETGYIDISSFALADKDGNEYYPVRSTSVLDAGVNILPKGHAVAEMAFNIPKDKTHLSLVIKHGIGNININDQSILLYGEPSILFSGDYYDLLKGAVQVDVLPTFKTGQEYSIDNVLSIMVNNAEYFSTTENVIDKFTYELTFTNTSDNVIIPVELRGFALYDVYHNILIKPTENITDYNELGFNPVQSGVSKVYNISFEIFEEIDDEYLHLLVYSLNDSQIDILFTK